VSFNGSDTLSGGVTCDSQVVLATEGAGKIASGRCYDAAGNPSAVVGVSGINIDKTNPTVAIGTPAEGAVYARNSSVIVSYSCNDALSGITSCTGAVASGQSLDTSKKISNGKVTVTATDKAGNVFKQTVNYSVK